MDDAHDNVSASATTCTNSYCDSSGAVFQSDTFFTPALHSDFSNTLAPPAVANTQSLDASSPGIIGLEGVVPQQSGSLADITIDSLTTCSSCGKLNNIMDAIAFLFSDADKTAFFNTLAGVIVSNPLLYNQLLHSPLAESVKQAAVAISVERTADAIAGASSKFLPEEESAAPIAVDDVLPEWSTLPPLSAFDGDLPDDDVSVIL